MQLLSYQVIVVFEKMMTSSFGFMWYVFFLLSPSLGHRWNEIVKYIKLYVLITQVYHFSTLEYLIFTIKNIHIKVIPP